MIDTPERLAEALEELDHASWIAIDTEADSLHAYPEKLCLLQLSHPGGEVLVDTLAELDLQPLLAILHRHRLILHGADYDLRLMFRTWRFEPHAIFDTMTAARFLGVRRFGLTDLVHQFLGLKLEKGPQKANWGQRPLTPRMTAYAEADARYLKPLQEKLEAELIRLGRLEWHQETCARIVSEALRLNPPDPNLVWRVRGSHTLDRLGLAVLRALWLWREQEALRANRPTFHILNPDALVDLAAAASRWGNVPHQLPRHLTPRRRQGLSNAVKEALALPPDQLPDKPRHEHKRHSLAVGRRAVALRERRDRHAEALDLDPSFLASRSQLLELAETGDWQQTSLLPWQARLLEKG
ncbi:MAG: HRDC domain-containing protein [Verrucomicrobiae bacterium]|nr:HRDC domain-containing protein [Verrucomicrobiae bacterium]